MRRDNFKSFIGLALPSKPYMDILDEGDKSPSTRHLLVICSLKGGMRPEVYKNCFSGTRLTNVDDRSNNSHIELVPEISQCL